MIPPESSLIQQIPKMISVREGKHRNILAGLFDFRPKQKRNLFRLNNEGHPNNLELDPRTIPASVPVSLTFEQAKSFIDLVPLPMCVIDTQGNIEALNSEFRQQIFMDPKTEIWSMLDVISPEDTDKFYVTLRDFTINVRNETRIKCDLYTKTNNVFDGARTFHYSRTMYHWVLSTDPDRRFILLTGQATMPSQIPTPKVGLRPFSSFIPEGDVDDTPDKIENDPAFSPAYAWTNFMDKVERKTKKFIELKIAEHKTEALSEALETKRLFVRHVSHEIRTPLNVVMSGLDYLNSFTTRLTSEMEGLILEIKSACSVAIDILNDLLTYEKIDSNILALEKTVCNMVDIVKEVNAMFLIQSRQSKIHLILEVHTDQEMLIDADSSKISQVLRNLISNAIKFTPENGTVTVIVSHVPELNRVRVEVRDTGAGMTVEDRKRLFNEIIQFHPKELQNGQGSGLGLFLTRRIVDMHEGVVCVDTEWKGRGSIFFVELPLTDKLRSTGAMRKPSYTQYSKTESVSALPVQDKKLRLLIVDDVVLCRKFHRRTLTPSCDFFVEACNGQEAVDRYKESLEQGYSFDAILMDSSMPFMNGTTATKLIRELGFKGLIFGVTGNAFQSDMDDFLAHGVDEVLVKPLSSERYAYIVQRIQDAANIADTAHPWYETSGSHSDVEIYEHENRC